MNHYELAHLPKDDFIDLVTYTSNKMGIREALIEKDFWVTVLLKYLFEDSPWKSNILFKGGTSLSKCYNAIQRFSEDVDLLLDWRVLGFGIDGPENGTSRKQQEKINDDLIFRTESFLREKFVPRLQDDLSSLFGSRFFVDSDHLKVWISYHSAFVSDYVGDRVLLEIGPRGIWDVNKSQPIHSYISLALPDIVSEDIHVNVLPLERTFCEKLLILHTNHSRGKLGPRHSRHYYDVFRLSEHIDVDILLPMIKEVAEFKSVYYPGSGYGYDDAKKGILRLTPPKDMVAELERDYNAMNEMLFGDIPELPELLKRLEKIQESIKEV